MEKFVIKQMTRAELPLLIKWAAKEGWNPGLYDAQCFYAADSQGFFIGYLNKKAIAIGSAVTYGQDFAFCGFYIVKPEYRQQNYGIQLTKVLLDHAGSRITGIDGVLDMVEKYKNINFKLAYQNKRFIINTTYNEVIAKNIVDLNQIPLSSLLNYDKLYFPAKRLAFLQHWICQPQSYALGYIVNDQLMGYGVIRKCYTGYKIGPLFADTSLIANSLLQALITKASNPPFFIDIPTPNLNAPQLIKRYQMQEVFATARMYRNGAPLHNLNNIYGITTFELG